VTNMETILVVNAGSSSLKFQVFALAGEGEPRFWPNFPVIRIHSELKRPPAVVIDTSQRMLAPVIVVQDDSPAAPAPVVMPDSRIRESSAQFRRRIGKRAPASRRSRSAIYYPNVRLS